MNDSAASQLLISTLRDALIGRSVDVGFMGAGKLIGAINSLKGDPHARVKVFEGCIRECIAIDPTLRHAFIQIKNESKL